MADLYTTAVTVAGGRDGRAKSDDGRLDLALAMPKEIGGSGGGTNPEQLFAAGFAACFNSSLRFAAKGMGLDAGDVAVTATVVMMVEDGAYGIRADLLATLPELAGDDRARVLAEAKRICAYSNALAGKADVTVALA